MRVFFNFAWSSGRLGYFLSFRFPASILHLPESSRQPFLGFFLRFVAVFDLCVADGVDSQAFWHVVSPEFVIFWVDSLHCGDFEREEIPICVHPILVVLWARGYLGYVCLEANSVDGVIAIDDGFIDQADNPEFPLGFCVNFYGEGAGWQPNPLAFEEFSFG